MIEKETELYKYKIVETKKQNKPIVNYIDDYTLIPANNNNIQHSKIEYIPFIHHTFKKKKSIYKTHHLSQTSFIIEKQDNKIFDFYFESSYDVDNVFFEKRYCLVIIIFKVIFPIYNVFLDYQANVISLVIIILVHYLFVFFKTNLTVPKIKDLVNRPEKKI